MDYKEKKEELRRQLREITKKEKKELELKQNAKLKYCIGKYYKLETRFEKDFIKVISIAHDFQPGSCWCEGISFENQQVSLDQEKLKIVSYKVVVDIKQLQKEISKSEYDAAMKLAEDINNMTKNIFKK